MMKAVCILPQSDGSGSGGVAMHVSRIARHLERRGWQIMGRPDGRCLVHCHAMARAPRVDVYTNHGIYPLARNMSTWQRDANRAIFENLRLARRVVAVSRWTSRQWGKLVGRWPEDERTELEGVYGTFDVAIIPNGVDLDEWREVPRGRWRGRLGIPEERPLVLWGKTSLSPVLDVTPAVELALRFPQIMVAAPLPGSLLPTAPPNFHCLGPQPFPAMQALLTDCDVYLATVRENHSIQVLEAMALGKPVLGYAWGGTAETIRPGYDGLLVEPGDLTALAAGLERLLEDRELAAWLGEAARQTVVERYQWSQQVERLEEVYLAALAEREAEEAPGRPKVSVVIPLYNKMDYIAETIGSAMDQVDAPLYEVIVVDDGSTDDSLAVVKRLARRARPDGPRLQVVSQANQGVAAARNRGIELAQGRYITCLDADDRIDPLFLARLSAALDADPGLGIAYSDMLSFGVHPEKGAWSGVVLSSEWDFERLRRGNFIPCCNMFRKVAWARAGGYKDINPSWEDYELWLNMGKLGWPGRRVPGALFHYRKVWREGRDYESQGQEWRLRAIVNSYHRELYPPMVSVVVPCYRQSHFLREAIDSALAQTFPDLEVVVVDDGNEEPERSAIREIVASYDSQRVWLVRLEQNRGLAWARNEGFRQARGQWIVPLDADDLLLPTFVEAGMRATELNPQRFAYSDSLLWWPPGVEPPDPQRNGRLRPEPNAQRGGMSQYLVAAEYDFGDLLRRITWPCTILVSKGAWRQVGGYKPQMSKAGGWEDWEFAISLGEIGVCGVRVPEALFIYRQHSANQMRNTAQERKPALQEAIRRLHPAIYRGEFPMGCCGGGGRQPAAGRSSTPATRGANQPMTDETVLVRYVGNSYGSQYWVGPSGRQYRFGVTEPLQEVLKADADWFAQRPDFTVAVPA